MSDLKSFKISEQVKQPVERPRPGQKNAAEPAPSAGFPRIEAIVESDAPDLSGLASRCALLEEMAAGKGTPREKAAAKKGAQAYARTRELLAYLQETKTRMAGR